MNQVLELYILKLKRNQLKPIENQQQYEDLIMLYMMTLKEEMLFNLGEL
jgi:hypothetical protein